MDNGKKRRRIGKKEEKKDREDMEKGKWRDKDIENRVNVKSILERREGRKGARNKKDKG